MDLELLTEEDAACHPEWNDEAVDYGPLIQYKTALFKKAYENFGTRRSSCCWMNSGRSVKKTAAG